MLPQQSRFFLCHYLKKRWSWKMKKARLSLYYLILSQSTSPSNTLRYMEQKQYLEMLIKLLNLVYNFLKYYFVNIYKYPFFSRHQKERTLPKTLIVSRFSTATLWNFFVFVKISLRWMLVSFWMLSAGCLIHELTSKYC